MNGKPFSARVILAIALLTTLTACATRTAPEVAKASAAPLVDSQWRLTTLGGQTIANLPGPQQVFFTLNPRNTAVTGFAGCNRMFGRYALDGEMLKFDAMGGTKMACMDQARMDIEQRFLTMFEGVAHWKLTDRELELFGVDGKSLATFEAQPG